MVTVPALGFASADTSFPNGQSYYWERDMYIPSHYQVDSTMTIVTADSGSTDPGGYL